MKKRHWLIVLAVLGLIGLGFLYYCYKLLREPNVSEGVLIEIPTGSDFEDVLTILERNDVLDDPTGFKEFAQLKNYDNLVKPGRYLIERGFSNEFIIDRLRSGEQVPVKLTFNNITDFPELAGTLSNYVETDSLSILNALLDDTALKELGFKKEEYFAAFVPNTYEVWWTVSAPDLVERLLQERSDYWNKTRRKQAEKLQLKPVEVATLASIVQEETSSSKDAPIIAGVYLNRLRIGMPLQADPTLIFALGDRSIRRVLDKDKEVESPYNTYKYAGLPPGPLNIPDIQYIEAVLDAPKHGYLYFCASPELDGTTAFARSYGEHIRNARAYQRALNQQGTYR